MTIRMAQGRTGHSRISAKALLAMLAVLGVTILVRIPAAFGHPLWTDELWRAVLILDPGFWHDYLFAPTVETAITSPVYALLVKFLALFWVGPATLRLSSLLPGVMCTLLAFLLIRKAGGSVGLALIAAMIFALNPVFIDYSNEMKPYMFEACVHLACVYVWLATVTANPPAPRHWTLCFAVLALALLSTPTAIFVLPAIGISLFFRQVVARGDLKLCVAGFAGLGLLAALLYYFSWRHGADNGMLEVWAGGFSRPGESYPGFLLSHFVAIWHSALDTLLVMPRQFMLALGALLGTLGWAVATGTIRRQPLRDIVLFYGVFFATLCSLNFLRLWPLDANRENIFLYSHVIVFLFMIVAQLPISRLAARFLLICAVPVLLWPAHNANGRAQYRAIAAGLGGMGAPLERSDLVVEDFSSDGVIGRTIIAGCPKGKTVLIANGSMVSAIYYYTRYDSALRGAAALLKGGCVEIFIAAEAYQDPDKSAATLAQALSGATDAWLLYNHLRAPEVGVLRHVAERFGRVSQVKSFQGAGYFKLVTNSARE